MTSPSLFVDAGNTRIKWGLWQAGRWQRKGVLPVREATGLTAALAQDHPLQAWVSCVAGETVREALQTGLGRLGTRVEWVAPCGHAFGLSNLYEPPQGLGSDRYAMLVACRQLGLAPCVIVGAGTAVTVDAMDGEGSFLGGLILPGPALMRGALVSGTAGVKEVIGQLREFPRTTGDGVETGIWRALAGAVEAMRSRLARGIGAMPLTVLSGGEAARLADLLEGPIEVMEDLVLEGLLWIARSMDAHGR